MSSPVVTIDPSASLADAAATMSQSKVGCLPVVREGELLGIVTSTDLLESLAEYPAHQVDPRGLEAAAIMTTKLHAVVSDDLLVDAAARMLQYGVRHLPVVDGMRRVTGILSDRDVRQAIGDPLSALEDATASARIAALRVSDVMTAEARTFPMDAALGAVVSALVDEKLGLVAIVDDEDRLLGVVSYIDVLRVWRRQMVAR